MLANQREARANANKTAQGNRRYSEKSKGSSYKDRAQQYYTSFGGKHSDAQE